MNTLPPSSLYVKHHPKKDHHELLCRRPRPSLLLLCALEVVRRGEEDAGGRDTVQSVMGDSPRGLVEGGEYLSSSTLVYMFTQIYRHMYIYLYLTPRPLYTSLLSNVSTTKNAAYPPSAGLLRRGAEGRGYGF